MAPGFGETLGDSQVVIPRRQILCEHRHDIVECAGRFGVLLGQVADGELSMTGPGGREPWSDQLPDGIEPDRAEHVHVLPEDPVEQAVVVVHRPVEHEPGEPDRVGQRARRGRVGLRPNAAFVVGEQDVVDEGAEVPVGVVDRLDCPVERPDGVLAQLDDGLPLLGLDEVLEDVVGGAGRLRPARSGAVGDVVVRDDDVVEQRLQPLHLGGADAVGAHAVGDGVGLEALAQRFVRF